MAFRTRSRSIIGWPQEERKNAHSLSKSCGYFSGRPVRRFFESDVRPQWNQRNKMLTAMLEAVLIDPAAKKVVGIVPRPAFRDLFLCLEENGAAKICEPDVFLSKMSNGDSGKNGADPSFAMSNGAGENGGPKADGLVETGGSRTPRPEDTPLECATGLSGAYVLVCSALRRRRAEQTSR